MDDLEVAPVVAKVLEDETPVTALGGGLAAQEDRRPTKQGSVQAGLDAVDLLPRELHHARGIGMPDVVHNVDAFFEEREGE